MKNGLTLLSLVFGGTSLLLSVDAAKAAVMVPVICDGMQVGTINAMVAGVGVGVTGGFTTTPMFPTLADAAAKCGEDHFNWYQVVVKDNDPPIVGGNPLVPPYVDPPNGGYSYLWADNFPWYWNEGDPPVPQPPNYDPFFNLSNQGPVTGNVLHFEDGPSGPDGTMISFLTCLASVNADHSLHQLYGGFLWDYVDPVGPTGPSIQNLRAKTPEPSSIVSLLALGGLGLVTRKRRA